MLFFVGSYVYLRMAEVDLVDFKLILFDINILPMRKCIVKIFLITSQVIPNSGCYSAEYTIPSSASKVI
jgi:hypothetical protein